MTVCGIYGSQQHQNIRTVDNTDCGVFEQLNSMFHKIICIITRNICNLILFY